MDIERRRTGASPWGWIIGAIVVIAIVWALFAAFNQDVSAEPNIGVTVSDITTEPMNFVGRVVTVSGEVNNVLGPRAFTMGGDEFFGGGELLVVGAEGFPLLAGRVADAPIAANDVVQVTGPVRMFNLTEFEREIGFDLDDAAFGAWEGKPAVIARDVDLTPRIYEPGL